MKKFIGSTIKLYKLVTEKNYQISVEDLTKLLLEFVQKCTNENLNQIYKNFNSNPLSLNKFYEFVNKNEVVEFSAYSRKIENEKNQTFINYGNSLLNRTGKYKKTTEYKNEIDFVDLIIYLDNYFIKENEVVEFIKIIFQIFNFDYGYTFYLEKNQSCLNERKGLFSIPTGNTEEDIEKREKMKEIKNGYVPKIYKYNFLNNIQIKTLNIKNIVNITNNLYLYIKEEE